MSQTIELDNNLYARLDERATNNGFESTEAYCQMVLQTVLEEIEDEGTAMDEDVEDRLEDLGYLR